MRKKSRDLSTRDSRVRDVNVRIVGVGRVGVCMMCVGDRESRERWVGGSVNVTILSEVRNTHYRS